MSTSPKSESAIMIVPRLVRVTWEPFRGDDVLVRDGEVQATAGVHLSSVGSVQLLPRRLVDERRCDVVAPPFGDLLVAEVYVETMVGYVERDAITRTQNGEVAADGSLGADIEDGRCIGGATLPAVAEGRDRVDSSHDQRGRWLHVHDFGRARV